MTIKDGNISVRVSEFGQWFDCQQRWDFEYGGYYNGGRILVPRTLHTRLVDGTAYGEGAATWHATGDMDLAKQAVVDSYSKYCTELDKNNIPYTVEDLAEQIQDVYYTLERQASIAPKLSLTDPELELTCEFPEYRGITLTLIGHVDGFENVDGVRRIIEFKKRDRELWNPMIVHKSRQVLWYPVLYNSTTAHFCDEVIFDETITGPSNPVKYNQNGSVSKVQSCHWKDYENACKAAKQVPDPDVLEKLKNKRWHQRTYVPITPTKFHETQLEMLSAVEQFIDFLVAVRAPVRNPQKSRCPGCTFNEVCDVPTDHELIEALFNIKQGDRYAIG